MKSLIASISILFFSSLAFADAPPVVLKDGKEFYEIGLNLDILEDPTGKLTIEDINSPEWAREFKRNKEKVPNFGFSDSVFWGRFKIKNNSKDENKWVVSQNYYLQDEVIFFKKDKGKWESKKTGDTLPFSTREIGTRSFSFQLNPKNESIYYFKIKGVTHQLNLSLSSMKYLIRNETKNNFVLGLFFGLIVTMIIYNLFIFISTKNITYLYYVLYVFFAGLWMAGYQGYSQKILFPETPWMSNNGNAFVHGNTVMFACIFTISFLKLKDNAPKLYRIISFFCITSFLITPCSLIFPYSVNVRLYVLNMMVAIPFIFYAGIYQFRNKFRPAKYFVYAWTFLLLGNFIAGLMALGILPSIFIVRLAGVIGFGIEILLLSIGLADQFNYQQEEALIKEKNLTNQLELEKLQVDEEVRMSNRLYKKVQFLNEGLVEREAELKYSLEQTARLNGELEIIRKSLKKTIEKERSEFSSILKQTNQVFLSINDKGLICQPISDFANTLFTKNIEGNRASDVLFPSLKRGMVEFNILSKSFGKLFGNTEEFFDETVKSFPTAINSAIGDSSEEKRFRISYSKILNTAGRVEKILCIVEDVTSESEIKWAYQEKAIRYIFLSEILSYSEKEKIEAATSLSHLTGLSLQLLDLFSKGDDFTTSDFIEDVSDMLFTIHMNTSSVELERANEPIVTEIEDIISSITSKHTRETISSISDKFRFMCGNFLKYMNELEKFNISVQAEFNVAELISMTEGIIQSHFSNLLEYTFVIRDRKIQSITDTELETAARNARTNSKENFEINIFAIYQKVRKLAILYSIIGNHKKQFLNESFSDQLKILPKAEVITMLDLKNNLIHPYILTMDDDAVLCF